MNPARSHTRTSLSAVKQLGIPLVLGVAIESLCDLLKHTVHYVSTSVYAEVRLGVLADMADPTFWIGIVFVAGLLAVAAWCMESWPIRSFECGGAHDFVCGSCNGGVGARSNGAHLSRRSPQSVRRGGCERANG
jgi:hypothetical protein